MKDVRIWFKKSDEAIYISHLDLNRTMLHAINASRLDVWHTEGFNPHPFVTFALPLSLGITGLNESMDVRLMSAKEDHEIIDGLNKFLPKSIRVFRVSEPVMKPKEIFIAEFQIVFDKDVTSDLMELLSRETLMVTKKTKSGTKVIDLKQQMFSYGCRSEGGQTILNVDLPAGNNANVNPMLLVRKFCEDFAFDGYFEVTRVGLFDEQRSPFK